MEIVIIVAIWSVVVKRGVEDILHTARGGTPYRYKAARQPGGSVAWGRYRRALVDDVATDLLRRHNERRARRSAEPASAPSRADKPRGAATQFFVGVAQDGQRAACRSWENAWVRADEKRRAKTTRPRPGQQTVPGEVVPNQDETATRPEDDARLQDEPSQDETQATSQDEQTAQPDPSQHDTVDDAPLVGTDGQIQDDIKAYSTDTIGDLRRRAERLEEHYRMNPWERPLPTTSQEGTTMTTTMTTEVVGLDSAIRFCDDSAQAYRSQSQAIEQTEAAIVAGGVTGEIEQLFAQCRERDAANAQDMETAARLFTEHKSVQEAYNANRSAGSREFVLNGQ